MIGKKENGIIKNIVRVAVILVYIIGIFFVGYYSLRYFLHSTVYVTRKDAMIPMMEYERAAFILTFGVPCMAFSCLTVVELYKIKKILYQWLCFLPTIYAVIVVGVYWGTGGR